MVENKYVSEYPLLLRSWDDLVNLVAGVQGQRYTDQGGSTSAGRTGGFNVHGIRQLENNFLLDGIDNNSISENVQELTTQVARPSVDALQEFKIITNPYSAEYSRGGAVISVISKGGTNEYHGTLYEYLRNRDTDANDFFSNRQGLDKPKNIRNQFGGNLGGPIKKNKLFAFFDEESTRIITGQLRSGTVPVDTERVGNFSAAAGAAVHTTYPTIYQNGVPVPNNIIPAGSISPVAASIMALFPEPTVAGAELNNYFRNANLTDNTDRYSTRVDWQASDKDSVFTRYTWSNRDRNSPGLFPGLADGTQSSSQGKYHLTADLAVIGWTRPISASLVNELRIGYEHDNSFAQQEPFGQSGGNLVPGVPNNPAFAGGVTMITFANLNTFIGSPNFLPKFQKTQQWQFGDTRLLDARPASLQVRHRCSRSANRQFPGCAWPARRSEFRQDLHLPAQRQQSMRGRHRILLCGFPVGRSADRHALEPVRGESEMVLVRLLRAGRFQGDAAPDAESRRSLRFLIAGLGGQQPLVEFQSGRQRIHHHGLEWIAGIAHLGPAAEAELLAAHRVRVPAESEDRAPRRATECSTCRSIARAAKISSR